MGALDFHHIDPTIKEFTVGNRDFKLEEYIESNKKEKGLTTGTVENYSNKVKNFFIRKFINIEIKNAPAIRPNAAGIKISKFISAMELTYNS